MVYKGRFRLKENVSYQVKDKFGNIKPIFQENKFWVWLHKLGLVNPRWEWIQKVPYIFGHWSDQKVVSNLVTDAGKAAVAGLINGGVTDFFDYIALGTGTTAAAAGDTALQTETSASGLARAASTNSRVTTDVTNDTARLTKTFTAGASLALTECGVFSASSGGTMLSRQVFAVVNLLSGDTYTPTFNYDID